MQVEEWALDRDRIHGGADMAQVRSWVGLDVHARTVVAAVIDGETGELVVRRISGETVEVVAFCAGLPRPTRVAYEAGPTGFALARALHGAGVGCVIAAPGKIERPAHRGRQWKAHNRVASAAEAACHALQALDQCVSGRRSG